MATSADPERLWYRIYKSSNAPPIAEVRGLTAAERRCKALKDRLTPEERAEQVFFYPGQGTVRPKLPRPLSSPPRGPKMPQRRTASRRGSRR